MFWKVFNDLFQMRYPAQVMIQGNTQKLGRSLVFNNGLAHVNGRQRTNKPGFGE